MNETSLFAIAILFNDMGYKTPFKMFFRTVKIQTVPFVYILVSLVDELKGPSSLIWCYTSRYFTARKLNRHFIIRIGYKKMICTGTAILIRVPLQTYPTKTPRIIYVLLLNASAILNENLSPGHPLIWSVNFFIFQDGGRRADFILVTEPKWSYVGYC